MDVNKYDINRIGAWIVILLIILLNVFLMISSLNFAYTETHYLRIEFWERFLFFFLMGYFWVELLGFFEKHRIIGYGFASVLLLSYHLHRAGYKWIFGDYLYLASISPSIGLLRHTIIEYSERNQRKTIFSNKP